MAIGLSMIEQLEDLRSLSTGQLKGMLGTPSPHASPVFIAMVLKEREDAEKRHAGRDAAAEAARQAPTVSARLQQPVPMSQAGAMAAPPQQPPMPQASQLAMALSGATGRPPPELPTVNAARGSTGAAVRELVKAMQRGGTRTASQMPGHQPFSSRERPPPVYNEGGLGDLIAAIVEAQSEKSKAYGGFDISEDIRLPRGRGGARAAARPVTAANGTQGRTVYAQDGRKAISGPRFLHDGRRSLEEVLGIKRTNRHRPPPAAPPLRVPWHFPTNLRAEAESFEDITKRTFPESERPEMTDAEGAAFAAALGEGLGATERMPVEQAAPSLSPEQARRLALEYGSYAEGMGQRPATEVAPEIVARRTSPPRRGNIPNPRFTEAVGEQYGQYGNMILADQAALAQTGEASGQAGQSPIASGILQGQYEQYGTRLTPPSTPRLGTEAIREQYGQYGRLPEGVDPVDGQSEFARQWATIQKDGAAEGVPLVKSDPDRDTRSAAQVWWDKRQEEGAARGAESKALAQRRSVLDKFRSDIGGPGSVSGFFRNTPEEIAKGRIFQQEFESVRPLLESDPVLFGRFGEDPQAFIEDRVAQKAAAKTMLSKDAAGPTVVAEKSAVVGAPATKAEEAVEEISVRKEPINKWPKRYSLAPQQTDGEIDTGLQQLQKQLVETRGAVTAVSETKSSAQQAIDEYSNTLNTRSDKIFSDLKKELKKFSTEDTKDLGKLETRFKALDDFYKTGKLPERMRKDRITNLLLEMSKGLLGNQNLYDAFKAGVEGFQAVDKAARKEYADGLAAMLTASKGIIDSKMAVRAARRRESIAMTQFAAAENRGNATLAMDRLKIAEQARQNARTHETNILRADIARIAAGAQIIAAGKTSETERLMKSLPGMIYESDRAKAEAGDRTDLDKHFHLDAQGRPRIDPLFLMKAIGDAKRGGSLGTQLALERFRKTGLRDQAAVERNARNRAEKLITKGRQNAAWVDIANRMNKGVKPTLADWSDVNKKAAWLQMAVEYYKVIDPMSAGFAPPQTAAAGGRGDPADVRSGITGATN